MKKRSDAQRIIIYSHYSEEAHGGYSVTVTVNVQYSVGCMEGLLGENYI